VFSDALDLRAMSLLHDAFGGRTEVTFGWGTNLTNDTGFEALSLVVKPDAVDGIPCVKLSDNIAKATGPRDEIERYARLVR
jgi:nicotinate phosphoribosyltransferase